MSNTNDYGIWSSIGNIILILLVLAWVSLTAKPATNYASVPRR